MSGAGRNEKRRQQAARQARLAAAGIEVPKTKMQTNRTPIIVVAIVVAVAVVAGVAFYVIPRLAPPVVPTYPATASGAVVTAGGGPVVVDVYEDFLCPECERLEQRYGNEIVTALNENKITVRFHTIAILDARTTPAGYSTRASDAALCAAPAGIYGKFRQKLFAEQPAENSAGLTDQQLVTFGTELGATGDFAGCVNGTTHDAEIKTETTTAAADVALQQNGTFGTPTVAIGGTRVDVNNAAWLQDAIAGK